MRNLRNFGITAAVSLVVLGLVAIFACNYVADTVCAIFTGGTKDLSQILNSVETSAVENNSDERFTKKLNGNSFTWLWVVSDYRPDTFKNYYPSSAKKVDALKDEFGILGKEYKFVDATNIILIHADVEKRDYTILTIPAVTMVETPGGDMTMGRLYALEGIDGLKEKIESMTGLKVEKYSVMHSTDLKALANTIGSVPVTIPKDIYTDGKNYISGPTPETTGADETTEKKETAKPAETSKKEDKKDTTEAETTILENELDKAQSVGLAAKLMAALLYYDPSDGIADEMTIHQSFAVGVMNNIKGASDKQLENMLRSLDKKFVANNVKAEDITAVGETIRAFDWLEITTLTYPGKFVGQRGNSVAYYNPDIDKGVAYFYDYR